jgi:DNA-binding response OmpR family regulator
VASPTILVVGRDVAITGLLLWAFNRQGHVAVRVADCAEAHELLLRLPDLRLLVVDFGPPYEAYGALGESLRRHHPTARLLGLVRGDEPGTRTAEACGADQVLKHPFELATLRTVVARLLPDRSPRSAG